ncbi:hypothetical protein SEETLT22_09231 [Salmonella enterica subsp. enterica serovar Typhimurium str. LT2-4]|nr:hypothetical protein SEETLT22_09231 [Salmonella enterica subsp. enterica serovar Typhimurium str. LT2-4]
MMKNITFSASFFQGIILVCGDGRKLVCGVVHARAAAALLLTTTGPGITRPGLQGGEQYKHRPRHGREWQVIMELDKYLLFSWQEDQPSIRERHFHFVALRTVLS